MKRTKIYCAILLILSMLCTSHVAVLAETMEFGVDWLVTFEDGVDGYIYSSTPFGFIVHKYDYDTHKGSSALVDGAGFVIDYSEKLYSAISDDGLLVYHNSDDYMYGVTDIDGNVIINNDKYDTLFIIGQDRFLVSVVDVEAGYTYRMGIIDRKGNEIVPIGKYTFDSIHRYYDYYKNFKVYDENKNSAIIDCDGNFVVPFGSDYEVSPTCLADRYLAYDKANDKSYIRKQDGSVIAEFDGEADFHFYNYFEIDKGDNEGNGTVYEYDMDGNLVNTVHYSNYGRPYGYKDIYAPKRYELDSVYEDNSSYDYVFDTLTGNKNIYPHSEFYVGTVYDNGFMVVSTTDTWNEKLLTLNGDAVLPGEYDSIEYCEELDIWAVEKDNKIAIVKINPISVKVNGEKIVFDQNPIIKDGRTLVPLRAIFEALGASVEWDGATQTVTSSFSNTTIKLTIGSNKMYVNSQELTLDVPAEVMNGRTLVPVRAVSEAFGCSVNWDDATKTVSIY